MLKKLLRKPYREALKKITLAVIKKHHPRVIAVVGNGQTSIARELIYKLLKEKYPTRRNLESPESEFSVPLTIIGYGTYPKNAFEWLFVLIKSYYNLVTLKPYSHFLVLELNFKNSELLFDWLKITAPETIFIVGSMNIDYSVLNIKKVVKVAVVDSDDILAPYRIVVKQLGKYYEVDEKTIDEVFDKFSLPTSKIRYFPGKNDSTILDATHYYYPINLGSVLEMVNFEEDRVVLFSDLKNDLSSTKDILVNPDKYNPQKNDLIILRGDRTKVLKKYEHLLERNIPLS